MNIFVKLKSAGKKRPVLNDVPYTLPDGTDTLRGLIFAVVRAEVKRYNDRGTENMLVPFLSEREIEDGAAVGKVGFGRIYNERTADADKAAEAALLAFEDGLFRVLIGSGEVTELDEKITISEGDTLTFIRLTFLAGRMW